MHSVPLWTCFYKGLLAAALKWPVSPSTERVIGLAENPVRVIEKILEQAGLGDKIDREAINNMAVYADELVPIEILEMPFVTSPETAQRLATRYLKLKKSPPDA